MAKKVLILLGTRKGAFIARERCGAAVVVAARAVLRDLADEPCRRPTRRPARSMAAAAMNGSARRCGNPTDLGATWTHSSEGLAYRGRRRADQGGVEPCAEGRQRSMPACSRPGCSAATTAASPGSMSTGLQQHPSRPDWHPGGAGLILHSLVPHPERRASRSGSASRRRACSTPRMAARHGSRATAAPAPTSCRRARAIPNSANACIAS